MHFWWNYNVLHYNIYSDNKPNLTETCGFTQQQRRRHRAHRKSKRVESENEERQETWPNTVISPKNYDGHNGFTKIKHFPLLDGETPWHVLQQFKTLKNNSRSQCRVTNKTEKKQLITNWHLGRCYYSNYGVNGSIFYGLCTGKQNSLFTCILRGFGWTFVPVPWLFENGLQRHCVGVSLCGPEWGLRDQMEDRLTVSISAFPVQSNTDDTVTGLWLVDRHHQPLEFKRSNGWPLNCCGKANMAAVGDCKRETHNQVLSLSWAQGDRKSTSTFHPIFKQI